MASQTDRFLQAEQMADDLVETLKQLHAEAASYKTSGEQLGEVRSRLVTFVEKTERIAQETHELIQILREIGGPEILRAIGSVSDDVKRFNATNTQHQKQLKLLILVALVSSVIGLLFGILLFLK